MKITQEGDRVRLQLIERMGEMAYKKHFNFTVHKDTYPELKKHMIKALQDFEIDE